MRRFPLALLLVGLLGLLAAGGAVLGAFEAPTGADLTVHNGAGETLAADHVVGSYTASYLGTNVISFDYTATPARAYEVAKSSAGKVRASRTVHGATATGILQPISKLLTLDNFTERNGVYVSVVPVSSLVAPAQQSLVRGTYRTSVRVSGGYVVGVLLDVTATEGTQHLSQQVDYRLTAVGSWRAG